MLQADSAENVNAILLSSQTEQLVMKMNWKLRKHAKHHITKRAAEFDVTVPEAFAGFNIKKELLVFIGPTENTNSSWRDWGPPSR